MNEMRQEIGEGPTKNSLLGKIGPPSTPPSWVSPLLYYLYIQC